MTRPTAPSGFTGFRARAFEFLFQLGIEQSRDWFEAHRQIYETDLREPLHRLLGDVSAECARRGLPLTGDPRRSSFRIHRDVRFGRDKRPYKSHVSGILSRTGEKWAPGLLYVHIDPQGSFVASGFYAPEPADLARMRRALVADVGAFRAITAELDRAGLPLQPDGEALTRLPRGFDGVTDADLGTWLRQRSWIVRRPLSDADLGDAAAIGHIADVASAALPLLRFGWAAIDAARE